MSKNVNISESKEAPVLEKVITLSDGSTAKVIKAKGRQVYEAQKLATSRNGAFDQNKYMSEFMAQAIVITKPDGTVIRPIADDLLDLWSEDYLALQVAFGELNFTLPDLEQASA